MKNVAATALPATLWTFKLTVFVMCPGLVHGQHVCNGSRDHPEEEDCGGR